jgi:hypothetical protein
MSHNLMRVQQMARPYTVTALQIWMLETGRTDVSLAEELSDTPEVGKSISSRQVARWRKGLSMPRPYHVAALTKLSEGRVDANTFAEARMKEDNRQRGAAQ